MTEKTFEQVIEEHRREIGAKAVHVDFDRTSTPQELEACLHHIRKTHDAVNALDPLSVARANIERYKTTLSKITKLCQRKITDTFDESSEMTEFRMRIFSVAESALMCDFDDKQILEFAEDEKKGPTFLAEKRHARIKAEMEEMNKK